MSPNMEMEPALATALESWLETGADPWLSHHVLGRLDREGIFGQALAVAVLRRFQADSWSPGRSREALERTLGGQPDPGSAGPARWIRSRGGPDLREVEANAALEVHRLRRVLGALKPFVERMDPDRQRQWVDACHARDDLQALHDLIAERLEGPGVLAGLLPALDALGDDVACRLPLEFAVDDERLRRARRIDPEAWWTQGAGGATEAG